MAEPVISKSADAERVNRNRALLNDALALNAGPRDWRGWKAAQAGRFVAMATRAPRLELVAMSLECDLVIGYTIEMPVPRWPVQGRLNVVDRALFHLRYQDDWRFTSPPGWAPLGLVHPRDPYHPNCKPDLQGAICLGSLPPNTSPVEICLLGYFTLTLQDVQLDESDPHGVMNRAACEFYRGHPEYLPLTTAGLYEPWAPSELRSEP